jgi:hypothetical protein
MLHVHNAARTARQLPGVYFTLQKTDPGGLREFLGHRGTRHSKHYANIRKPPATLSDLVGCQCIDHIYCERFISLDR